MDVVLCHRTADFDTLGAAVGVARLQPGTRIVLCGGAHPAVREFLALYRDEYPLIERRSVSAETLRSLTIVDVQQRELLDKASEWLEIPDLPITIYDHHLEVESDIPAQRLELEPVGAATTILVEKLQAQAVQISAPDATVMALGIHVDTGSLTYDRATPRDAVALAWLMTQGANQQAIATYTDPRFSAELQELLGQALHRMQTRNVHGYQIAWVLLHTANYVPGLSSLASQLMTLSESDSLMLGNAYQTRKSAQNRLNLIGRCRVEGINLHQLLHPLGGGGHPRAAAATLKTDQPQVVIDELLSDLVAQIPQPLTAADLMSSPVRTIRPHTTINQARRILLRYGHSGLSVLDDQEQLVGIISRRDLDLALHHGFGHAPTKGYMKAPVRTICLNTPLPEIERLMVTYDIGRLPVLDKNQLVGIVTRTDMLRQLHQLKQPELQSQQTVVRTSMQDRLQTLLPQPLQAVLTEVAQLAEQQGWQLYLVGGAVRDLLLAEQPPKLQEFDLVVDGVHTGESEGAALAQLVQQRHPEAQLQIFGQFQTAALLWNQDPVLGTFAVDIATARSEFYPYPAANPEVTASSIRQDLYRRDFTINALAVRLTPHRQRQRQGGELLDFFGGLEDLQQRQVRVLHPNSFIEDPTRIFRAVRFATRLGFEIEGQTERYVRNAISSGIYQQTQGENQKTPALQARLRNELKYIFKTDYWPTALKLLENLDALQCLHPQLNLGQNWWKQSRIVLRWHHSFDPEAKAIPQWLLILEHLLLELPPELAHPVAITLHLSESSQQRLKTLATTQQALAQLLSSAEPRPSLIARQLQQIDLALLLLLAARGDLALRCSIWQYLNYWSQLKPLLNGSDLIRLGYQPGQQFKQMLSELWAEMVDGTLRDRATAEQWVQHQYPLM
ncbi:Multifunctional CCA protein [Acaryochloris thomasi RCC1774]|uniref:Multifunctional CCA protein n=1 Tax=Acaryochloris thomasi RCC1774 TaxID=1764569 RepID=A0A2W1JE69_9CYAN|nr:CBS domain-containing protein [Acaryochloris thomasi]PZD72006.1 Multifunctional CCA protein [Acaryochloris thomasi RCC1774]